MISKLKLLHSLSPYSVSDSKGYSLQSPLMEYYQISRQTQCGFTSFSSLKSFRKLNWLLLYSYSLRFNWILAQMVIDSLPCKTKHGAAKTPSSFAERRPKWASVETSVPVYDWARDEIYWGKGGQRDLSRVGCRTHAEILQRLLISLGILHP